MTLDQIILTVILLIIAGSTLGFTAWQTYLSRKALYGEIYEKPPLERVGFFELKNKHDKRVRFKQAKDGGLFEKAILPKNSKVPLCVTWSFKKKQSFQHLSFGFRSSRTKKPRVLKKLSGWTAKVVKPLKTAESIDLDGYYHIEYPNSRYAPIETPFAIELRIETGGGGEYDFHIQAYSREAAKPFEKTLKVIVE